MEPPSEDEEHEERKLSADIPRAIAAPDDLDAVGDIAHADTQTYKGSTAPAVGTTGCELKHAAPKDNNPAKDQTHSTNDTNTEEASFSSTSKKIVDQDGNAVSTSSWGKEPWKVHSYGTLAYEEQENAENTPVQAQAEGELVLTMRGNPLEGDQALHMTGGSMELYVDSSDTDSAVGDFSFVPSTQSLRPSVYDYITENGRRFHRFRSGQYHLPNDETEQDRLDLQHHMFMFTIDDKLHLAPIEILEGGLNNVLDIGTGTGLWATEFANEYPMANVLGSDLSPIQPDFVPPNCRFEVDDVEDEWLHSYKFDYIHGRALAFCFRSHETVFGHAFNALRPGGWFEIQDVAIPMVALDETVAGTAVELWVSRLIEGGRALGRDFTRVPTYKEILEDIGYVDVVERHFHWPVGTWAKGDKMKTLGAWMREDFLSGIQGASMGVMVKGLGMTVEEVEVFLVDVRNDIWSNRIHSYFPVHVVYGRKPY